MTSSFIILRIASVSWSKEKHSEAEENFCKLEDRKRFFIVSQKHLFEVFLKVNFQSFPSTLNDKISQSNYCKTVNKMEENYEVFFGWT